MSVLPTWGGAEQDSFLAMVKPFEDQTGVKIQYEGTRDLNAVLSTRVQGGNPPDVAGLPGPGQMAQFASAGKLIDLSNILDMTAMKDQYPDTFLKFAQVNGKQVGIFIKAALKGPIWYNPKQFTAKGYTVPKTWDELTSLSNKAARCLDLLRDPALRKRMAVAGREHVRENFLITRDLRDQLDLAAAFSKVFKANR